MHDYLAVSQASRAGAGAAAAAGSSMRADCAAVTAVASSLGTGFESLDRIEVFRSEGTGQVAGATNVYRYRFGEPGDCSNWDSVVAWSPSVRNVRAGTGPLDRLGVRLVFEHGFASGVPPFVGHVTIDEASITGLVPRD